MSNDRGRELEEERQDSERQDSELSDMVSHLTSSKEAMSTLGSAVVEAMKSQGFQAGQPSSSNPGGSGQPAAIDTIKLSGIGNLIFFDGQSVL